MIKRLRHTFIIIGTALLVSSCTSTQFGDVFSGYAQQMADARLATNNGDFSDAIQKVDKRSSSDGTYALSLLEIGRLQFLNKDWENSQKTFDLAYSNIQKAEAGAKLQVSRGFENIGSVMSNDNARRYDVPLYEQSMMHSYQALNYLYEQGIESALVEVRRANLVQERALKANASELNKAQQKMSGYGISPDALSSTYPSMAEEIGEIKNGFQNAYTFYLSGILYEAAGEENDAYIDYKKALEIFPDNQFLQQDVLRLASKLQMTDDLASFKKLYGKYKPETIENAGQVVFVVEQGIVEAQEEVSLNIPWYSRYDNFRAYSFALPVYRGNARYRAPLTVSIDDQQYASEEIVRIQALAARQLQDQLPGMVVRQILRLIAKEEMRRKMAKEGGDLGNILASLYNIASERADTRSWGTLPDNVQILRMNLPQGSHQLDMQIAGKQQQVTVQVNKNRITLVNLTNIGNYTGYQMINL